MATKKEKDTEVKEESATNVLEMPVRKKPARTEKDKLAALERRKSMAEDPNSIFWYPFDGRNSYDLKNTLINIDRSYRFVRKEARSPETIDKAMKITRAMAESSKKIWDIATSAIPKLFSVTAERYRDLNNDISEKRLMAKIPSSIGIVTTYPEIGQMVMAVKQIESRAKILQDTNLEDLSKLLPEYGKMIAEIRKIEKLLQDALSVNSGKKAAIG